MVNLDTFINKNEITRKDFDDLVANYKLETYSQESIHKYIESTSQLMEKGENDSLSSNEELAINIAKAEIGNLRKYVVLDVLEGQIVKVPMYVQEQMVDFEKGVYIDNSVNRKLGRVGRQWGGKKPDEGSSDDKGKKEEKDNVGKVGKQSLSSVSELWGGGYMISGYVDGKKRINKIKGEDLNKVMMHKDKEEVNSIYKKYLIDNFDPEIDEDLKKTKDKKLSELMTHEETDSAPDKSVAGKK